MKEKGPFWEVHPWLTAAVATVVILALIAGIVAGIRWLQPVYVTDGSHVFNDNLRAVERQIETENERVRASGQPYVSIAFADELTSKLGVDPLTPDSARHDVEGAFLAQLAWNHPIGKAPRPLVQLLLADEGSGESTWQPAAKALEDATGPEHLVAVAGLGISVDNTRSLIADLAAKQIAMVAGALTGDDITLSLARSDPIPGLVRIAHTNRDEARAAVHYLDLDRGIPDQPGVMLVQDQNDKDVYAQSLGSAFTSTIRSDTSRTYALAEMNYDSSLGDAGVFLRANADRVCTAHTDVVYFAGRGVDLEGFLEGLADRSCAAIRPLTVVSGDDSVRLAGQHLWNSGAKANMTVVLTSLANPAMWTRDPTAAPPEVVQRFTGSCGRCYSNLFPGESLDDGDAILAHDAVWAAELGVEKAVAARGDASALTTQNVAQTLPLLSNVGVASGWICAFDTNHDPVDKAVPIVDIGQNGKVTYDRLSSASGAPPTGGCPF